MMREPESDQLDGITCDPGVQQGFVACQPAQRPVKFHIGFDLIHQRRILRSIHCFNLLVQRFDA